MHSRIFLNLRISVYCCGYSYLFVCNANSIPISQYLSVNFVTNYLFFNFVYAGLMEMGMWYFPKYQSSSSTFVLSCCHLFHSCIFDSLQRHRIRTILLSQNSLHTQLQLVTGKHNKCNAQWYMQLQMNNLRHRLCILIVQCSSEKRTWRNIIVINMSIFELKRMTRM